MFGELRRMNVRQVITLQAFAIELGVSKDTVRVNYLIRSPYNS